MGIFTVNANHVYKRCIYCDKCIGSPNIKRHQKYCHLNPKNIKWCPVCEEPIKSWRDNITCSYSCANTFFRSGPNNPGWKIDGSTHDCYQSTCFYYHGKKCVVCEERLIICAHHLDGNKENNVKENLVPLCPTHHQYWHSRYRYLIENKVKNHMENKIKEWCIAGIGV